MKRWIALVAAAGLLVQGTAAAWMAPALAGPAAAQEQVPPCHGDQQDEAPAQPVSADCCDGDCACADFCSGHLTPAAVAAAPMPSPEPRPEHAAVTPAVHAAYALTPLRPPIASQS